MPPLHLSAARKNKRGVSPIIATILLVAITVVIAAVLYVLVSGYLKGTGGTPMSIQLANPSGFNKMAGAITDGANGGSCGAAGDLAVTFGSLTATSGMTTADFGLKIQDVNKGAVAFTCAVLESATGTGVAVFTGGATATWDATESVSSSDTLVVDVGATSLAGTGDTVVAYGIGGNSVSGGYSAGF